MIRGVGKFRFRWALVAAAAMGAGYVPAAEAADLGGDCCADLEERIAELEATTARKGNRKVSLEIYGQVNQSVLWWDDGEESNAYVVTNDNARTRFGFRGKAKIDSDWEAGYRIEIGIRSANSKRATQFSDDGGDNPADVGLDLRDSYWYLKSKSLGQTSVGLQASATDQITEINQTQTADFAKYSDVEDTGLGFLLRSSVSGRLTGSNVVPVGDPTRSPGEAGITWRRLIGDGGDQPGEGERRYNLVKYTTPEFAGFTASASWGEDDFWDVALRYTGSFAGLKVAAGAGYGQQKDGFFLDTKTVCIGRLPNTANNDASCDQFGGSFSVIHEETGLFLNAAAGIKRDDLVQIQTNSPYNLGGADPDQKFWSIQAGIEKKWTEYGKTTVYGEYYDYDGGAGRRSPAGGAGDALNADNGLTGASVIWDSGVQVWGLGVAQGFDKAALTVYLSYRHVEGDLTLRGSSGATTGVIVDAPIEDLDLVHSGAVIKF